MNTPDYVLRINYYKQNSWVTDLSDFQAFDAFSYTSYRLLCLHQQSHQVPAHISIGSWSITLFGPKKSYQWSGKDEYKEEGRGQAELSDVFV